MTEGEEVAGAWDQFDAARRRDDQVGAAVKPFENQMPTRWRPVAQGEHHGLDEGRIDAAEHLRRRAWREGGEASRQGQGRQRSEREKGLQKAVDLAPVSGAADEEDPCLATEGGDFLRHHAAEGAAAERQGRIDQTGVEQAFGEGFDTAFALPARPFRKACVE